MIKRLLLLALALIIVQPAAVLALSVEQKKVFQEGIGYFNTEDGCESAPKIAADTVPDEASAADIQKVTPAPYTGPGITPTGVMLHWTGGAPNESVESIIYRQKAAGTSTQLYVDGSGKVYQLVDNLATLTHHVKVGDNRTIAIAIAAGSDGSTATAKYEISHNMAQQDAVVGLVSYLVRTYGMKVGSDPAKFSGVLSEHQVDPTKDDVGNGYLSTIVQAVKGGQTALVNSGTCVATATDTPGGDPASNRKIGQAMAAERGWGTGEWICLDNIFTPESDWKQNAINDAEGNNDLNHNHVLDGDEFISETEHDAYGIPQSLPGGKMASVGADWRTNPHTQIKWGLDYIAARYQTPCGALTWRHAHGWY